MSRFDPTRTTLISSGDRDRLVVEACDPEDYIFRIEEAEREMFGTVADQVLMDDIGDDNVTQEVYELVDDYYVLS